MIPGSNNLRLVNYAMGPQAGSGHPHGVPRMALGRRLRPLEATDGGRCLVYVGSSNMDPRSLRLNFELDTEIYDRELAGWIGQRIDAPDPPRAAGNTAGPERATVHQAPACTGDLLAAAISSRARPS